MLNYIEYLNLPTKVVIVIVAAYLVMNLVGSILDFRGKVVPEIINFKKYLRRKKTERETMQKMTELMPTLKEVPVVLKDAKDAMNEVNNHYSDDNIAKRNGWMTWVNDRAEVYDDSIKQLKGALTEVTQALKDNTKMTEEMFAQSSRDRIIDFATKVSNENIIVSREEFNRIFKVYTKYEKFLEERSMTNGEVDIAIRIINESYEKHLRDQSFVEDVRGYDM